MSAISDLLVLVLTCKDQARRANLFSSVVLAQLVSSQTSRNRNNENRTSRAKMLHTNHNLPFNFFYYKSIYLLIGRKKNTIVKRYYRIE